MARVCGVAGGWVIAGVDRAVFEAITGQLKAKAVRVKTGSVVDASIIASASADDA